MANGHRVEPAADDDVLDAVQAWIEAGCPRGGAHAAKLLRDIEQTGLFRERCILAHEERATVIRVTDYQIAHLENERAG